MLSQLEPKNVFEYFEIICGIPHGSGNTDAIAEYIVNFAKERGLDWYRDGANNVLVTKAASEGREGEDTLILQAHTDMVCEKDPGVDFDFTGTPCVSWWRETRSAPRVRRSAPTTAYPWP